MPPSLAVNASAVFREPLPMDREPPPPPPPPPLPRRGLFSSLKRAKAAAHDFVHDGPHPAAAPVFKFGLVADIQFGCRGPETKKRGSGKHKTTTRVAWNESLRKLDAAVRVWNAVPAGLTFVQSLGDIIEGNESYLEDLSERELRAVLDRLHTLHAPVTHVLGNHCRRVSENTLLRMLGLGSAYYDFAPAPGWRVVCLDTTELCAAAVDASQEMKTALRRMEQRLGRPHQSFNGAVGDEQLVWLDHVLRTARLNAERVIVMTHYPLKSGSARDTHLALNAPDILDVMARSEAHIVAVFAGHDHVGGFVRPDPKATPPGPAFITIPALVEAANNAFATVSAFPDGTLLIAGHGSVPSRKLRPARP